MKNKFIILLVFLFFYITPVNAINVDYNLKILSDGTLEEKSVYKINNFIDLKNGYNYQDIVYSDKQAFIEGKTIYNKNIKKNGNDYTITFDYLFDKSNFKKSNYINSCFDNYNFAIENNKISFSSNSEFYCFSDENNISINIIVDEGYKMVSNNADKVNENIYTWNPKSEKFKINFEFNKNNSIDIKKEKTSLVFIVIIATIIVLSISTYLFIKMKELNRI